MGNAGRDGGEYYTPRPLIRAMVQVVDPKIGECNLAPTSSSTRWRNEKLLAKGLVERWAGSLVITSRGQAVLMRRDSK